MHAHRHIADPSARIFYCQTAGLQGAKRGGSCADATVVSVAPMHGTVACLR